MPPLSSAQIYSFDFEAYTSIAGSFYKGILKWILYTGDRIQRMDNGVLVLPYLEALEELSE